MSASVAYSAAALSSGNVSSNLCHGVFVGLAAIEQQEVVAGVQRVYSVTVREFRPQGVEATADGCDVECHLPPVLGRHLDAASAGCAGQRLGSIEPLANRHRVLLDTCYWPAISAAAARYQSAK